MAVGRAQNSEAVWGGRHAESHDLLGFSYIFFIAPFASFLVRSGDTLETKSICQDWDPKFKVENQKQALEKLFIYILYFVGILILAITQTMHQKSMAQMDPDI